MTALNIALGVLTLATMVLGDFVLLLTIHSFDNPEGRCADTTCQLTSGCCEGQTCPNSCTYYFSLCLRPAGTNVSMVPDNHQEDCSRIRTDTQEVENGTSFEDFIFGSTDNPIILTGEEWPVEGVQLYVELIDSDSSNSDELIDRFSLAIVDDVERQTVIGIFNFAEINVSVEILCKPGYIGPDCLSIIDNCTTGNCTCPPGFTGPFCVSSIDDCVDVDCVENQICVDGHLNYTCVCEPGFTGPDCLTNIDDCIEVMCANSGTCRDEIETFTCMCPPEFTGELCETELDRYELQVTVNSFSNPEGMCADDTCLSNSGCCEGNIECPVSCNYYFSLCLRPVDTSLSEIRDVDQRNCSTFETEIQQVFSGATFRDSIFGTPNPLTLSGFNPEFLADGVQLYVELRDSDLTNSDELIDRFATNISIEVGEAESFTTTGKFGFAEMDITTRIVCAENFYGPLCETFCLENCTCPPGFTGEFCSNTNMADTTTTASTTTSLGTPGASTTTIIIAILAVLCVIAVAITMLVIVCSFVAGKRRRKSYRNYADLHQNVLKVDQNQWDWSLENSAKVFSSTSDSNSPLQTLESEYSKLEHVSEKPHSNGNTPHSLALALTSTSTSVSTPSSTQPLIRETSTNTYIREGSNDDTVFSPSPPPFFNAGANGRLGLTEEVDLASTTTTGGGSGPPRNDDSASYATAGSGTELSGNNDYAIADGGTENTGAGDGTEPSSRIESGHTTADSGIESGYTMAGTGTESGYTMAGGGIEPGYTMAGSTFDDSAYLGSYTNDDHYQYSPQTGEYDYESPYWKPSNERGKLLAEFKRLELRSITQGELEEKEVLGSGAFGTVYRGVWLHKEGEELVKEEEVAVKTLDNRASKRERIKFLQEAAIMGQFNHPNIVSILGVKVTADECKIVMELMTVGNFRSHLPTLKSSLSNQSELASQLLFYSRQVASGMNYLAVKGFVHRDLAARNILVSKNDVCKIADFGLSRALQEEDCYTSQGGKVPVKWTAPEAINYRTYSPASDVWSYGCVLYEIWSLGTKPFHDLANSEVMDKLVTGYRLPPPPGCPRAIYDIMIKCWNDDPKARPRSCSICTAINLPEFKVLKWSEEDLARYGEEARTIGAPLEAAEHVFAELQDTYKESAHQ